MTRCGGRDKNPLKKLTAYQTAWNDAEAAWEELLIRGGGTLCQTALTLCAFVLWRLDTYLILSSSLNLVAVLLFALIWPYTSVDRMRCIWQRGNLSLEHLVGLPFAHPPTDEEWAVFEENLTEKMRKLRRVLDTCSLCAGYACIDALLLYVSSRKPEELLVFPRNGDILSGTVLYLNLSSCMFMAIWMRELSLQMTEHAARLKQAVPSGMSL